VQKNSKLNQLFKISVSVSFPFLSSHYSSSGLTRMPGHGSRFQSISRSDRERFPPVARPLFRKPPHSPLTPLLPLVNLDRPLISIPSASTIQVFAICKIEVFSLAKWQNSETRNINFRDFWATMLLLALQTTGEAWNGYMHDFAVEWPRCTESDDYLQSDCELNLPLSCSPLQESDTLG
jgi:hypothetical protein